MALDEISVKVRERLKSTTKLKLAEELESSRTTLDRVIEAHPGVSDATLIKFAEKLEGSEYKKDFVIRYRDKSPTFEAEARIAELQVPELSELGSRMPLPEEILNPKYYNILRMTSQSNGIAVDTLKNVMKGRTSVIEDLLEKEIIVEIDSRYYSKHKGPNDLNFWLDLIKSTINLKQSNSDTFPSGNDIAMTGHLCLDQEGVKKVIGMYNFFADQFKDLKENHSSESGQLVSLTLMGLSHIKLDQGNGEKT